MEIAVIGSGYVGLVAAACFSKAGHIVWCMDNDETKIERLNNGGCPIYEPGLPELLKEGRENGRLHFSTSLEECLRPSQAVFLAVGTPEGEDGSADVTYIQAAARDIGRLITSPVLVVIKSTVPVG